MAISEMEDFFTNSHLRYKSGNILKIVQDRDTTTTSLIGEYASSVK